MRSAAPRRDRPRRRRAAEQRDELASPHSITSSAAQTRTFLIGLLLAVVPDIGCELPVASNLLPHNEIFAGDLLRRRTLGLEAEGPDLSRRGGPGQCACATADCRKIIRTLGDAVDMIDENLPESLRVAQCGSR